MKKDMNIVVGRNSLMSHSAPFALTAAGAVSFREARGLEPQRINHISLRQLLKPAKSSGTAQDGPGNVADTTKT